MPRRRTIEVVESGSAAVRLAAAEAFLEGVPADGEAVIVAASRDAADELARRVTRRRRATVGLHRFTLTQLAARLAAPATSAAGLAPCTPLGAHAVAARAAFDALSDGRIPYFAPVARMPGFTLTLAATLAELRGAGLDGATMAAAAAPGDQLAAVLRGYEAQLDAGRLADRAALFAAATAAVDATPADPLIGLPLLLLDVPLDSRREREFATRLVDGAGRSLATIPAGDTSPRRTHPSRPHTAPAATSLAHVQTYLFTEDEPPAAEPDESLQLFSAPGEGREAIEIARRILPRRATAFRSIASPSSCAIPRPTPRARSRLLRRAGIPAWSRAARGGRIPPGAPFSRCSPAPRKSCPLSASPNTSRSARCRASRRPRPGRRRATTRCPRSRRTRRRAPTPTRHRRPVRSPRRGGGSRSSSKQR
jgi:hypothetical protein